MRNSKLWRAVMAAPALVAVAVVSQLTFAAPAHAGQVGVTVGIRGAGKVTVVEGSIEDGPTVCDHTDNHDGRVTLPCDRMRDQETFAAYVWLRAEPSTDPSGSWYFTGWTGCDELRNTDGYQECGVHSGSFDSEEKSPVASFYDSSRPTVTGLQGGLTQGEATYTYTWSLAKGGVSSQCLFDQTGGWSACSSGVVHVWQGEGLHTISVRGVNASGAPGNSSSVQTGIVDTSFTATPDNLSSSRTATFGYHSGYGNAFACSLDYADWSDCGTGSDAQLALSGLSDGWHTFRVRASHGDAVDNSPASFSWTVDATPPDTSISTASTNGHHAGFTMTSDGSTSIECRLVRPSGTDDWSVCGSQKSYDDLADGSYSFQARGRDAAGNVDPTPATRDFVIDNVVPDTSFASGPADRAYVLTSTVAYQGGSSSAGSSFLCKVDAEPVACPGGLITVTNAGPGQHTVQIAAQHGPNVDPTPAQRSFVVPLTAGQLTAGKHWATKAVTGAYGGKVLRSSTRGAALTTKVAAASRIALVATKAARNGQVTVYAGSKVLARVNLAATHTGHGKVIAVKSFTAPYSGTIRVVVTSTGKPVQIEGLGVDAPAAH